MSCNICEFYKKKEFKTAKDFSDFKKRLNNLRNDLKLKTTKEGTLYDVFYSAEFKCENCGQHWRLVEPDQAFRGIWEKLNVT